MMPTPAADHTCRKHACTMLRIAGGPCMAVLHSCSPSRSHHHNRFPLDSDNNYRILLSVLSTSYTTPSTIRYFAAQQTPRVGADLSPLQDGHGHNHASTVIYFLVNGKTRHSNNGKFKTSFGVWIPSMFVFKINANVFPNCDSGQPAMMKRSR